MCAAPHQLSSLQEVEPRKHHALLARALNDLLVVAQEAQCPEGTVTLLGMLHQGVKYDTIAGLHSKCPVGHGHASYLRVLLSMVLLTRSTVLAFSIDVKEKGRIPEVLVSQPGHRRHNST